MRSFLFVLLCSYILLINLATIKADDDTCAEGKVPENIKESCKCCKMNCWNAKAEEATEKLGHIPGEKDESEAIDTLTIIKNCMLEKCTKYCKAQFRPRPFFGGM